VPLGGTHELFTKIVTGIRLDSSGTLGGGLLNEASSDSKESRALSFFWHLLDYGNAQLAAKINIPDRGMIEILAWPNFQRTNQRD
jgi:hypothetical protein